MPHKHLGEFAYDHLGNRYQAISKQGYTSTYTHNTVNQYTHVHTDFVFGMTADADISHDANGNLSVDAAGYAYAYDSTGEPLGQSSPVLQQHRPWRHEIQDEP